MVQLSFTKFDKNVDKEKLVTFLLSQKWPFHSDFFESKDNILTKIDDGYFGSDENQTFWMVTDQVIGFIRLFEIENDDESSPRFDIRIKEEFQGKGFGTSAVNWLVEYVFSTFNNIRRLEATTREDNLAMKQVLLKSGFKQEATYRKAWKVKDNEYLDSLGFAILKEESNSKE